MFCYSIFREQFFCTPKGKRGVFMSELARRVRERRAALSLSQEELADRMGYRSKSSITK